MSTALLHYRPWQGTFRPGWRTIWPIARVSLSALFRQRVFWVLYSLSLFVFLMFFFGSFLLGWAESQFVGNQPIKLGKMEIAGDMVSAFIRRQLYILSGSRATFTFFFAYQGSMTLMVLALTGSVLVGNDLQFRSLPFYLSKPISAWHYLAGKMLAVAVVVHLMTTVPALLLYAQRTFEDFRYLTDVNFFRTSSDFKAPDPGAAGWRLLLGIVCYGTILGVFLSLFLVTTALWQKRTVAIVIVWTSAFIFLRRLSMILVDELKWPPEWRLLDLWNTMGVLGQTCLGVPADMLSPRGQPEVWQAGLFLLGVSLACLIYLHRRLRSVAIVR